jgi:hypothetical protein
MLEYPDFFGSRVIDLIESISDCEKDITVNIDERGWCYIKGKYKTRGEFGLYVPRRVTGLEPLTVKQHAVLQYMLLYIARQRYRFLSANMMLYSKPYPSSYEIFNTGDFLYMRSGIFRELTFKVDLKCRKELAPVELLHELLKEHS